MKTFISVALASCLIFGATAVAGGEDPSVICPTAAPVEERASDLLTHAQEVWISALEWCESRAKPDAINPVDRDGTASYYCLQFKPDTFRSFGEAYGIISKGHSDAEIMSLMEDCELQRAILRGMIKDTTTNWPQQFPVCVLEKIGYPPDY